MASKNSIWRKGGPRHVPGVRIEDSRWVKRPNGKWRYETDSVSYETFCARRRESIGWFHGARVRGVA